MVKNYLLNSFSGAPEVMGNNLRGATILNKNLPMYSLRYMDLQKTYELLCDFVKEEDKYENT